MFLKSKMLLNFQQFCKLKKDRLSMRSSLCSPAWLCWHQAEQTVHFRDCCVYSLVSEKAEVVQYLGPFSFYLFG